jgi:ribosomal protein L37E
VTLNCQPAPQRLPPVRCSDLVRHFMGTKREWVELPECPNCGGKLENEGAESQGDGDMYDVLSCRECGPVYHWHASYCECGCGGHRLFNVYDPDWIPAPAWY